jgi:hypothetical protein
MVFIMKNFTQFFGIITLAVLIGLLTIGCSDDDGDGNGGDGSGYLGATLELSGQVYTGDDNSFDYKNYTGGDLTVSSLYGGSGTITGGKLNFTIGVPENLNTFDFEDLFGYGYDDVTSSSSSVQGVILDKLSTNPGGRLYKENDTRSESGNSFSKTHEEVLYVYVNKDVTVSGKGTTIKITDHNYTFTSKNFNLALKAGWNAVYLKYFESGTYDHGSTETGTISLSNPSLRWVLLDEK